MEDCVNSQNKNSNSLLKYLKITQLEIPTFDHGSDLKGTVSVVSSYSPFKNGNARFTTVPYIFNCGVSTN